MTERWEVRGVDGFSIQRWHVTERMTAKEARLRGLREMVWMKENSNRKGVLVHIRTYRVEVVYAWLSKGLGWWAWGRTAAHNRWDEKRVRHLFRDPIGKHSRRRAKAAALAAKPAGPCVLVAIRRRVKEVERGLREEG